MPGKLGMDSQSAIGSQDLKRDRSHAQEESSQSQWPPTKSHSIPSTDASHDNALPNGFTTTAQPIPRTNGDLVASNLAIAGPQTPPPLDQSWREHDANKSLGLLLERVAQECYKDLNGTLAEMSKISVQIQPHQTNGISPHAAEDNSEGSLQKKRLLLSFAKEQRDRFIKTLVIADACRNEDDHSKLIGVRSWFEKQRAAQASAIGEIFQTRGRMIGAAMPNPNIEAAMELLATGKAPWIPDLSYIPPKRLTAKQLLKTLRDMNVTLATRLSLHEEIPPCFQDYSIADGRATFTVKDEFEVDLSVADEDPSTPFYFIDIRMLFTPSSNIVDDRLRGFLETKVNHELATKGLKGCYDFLHNFVLTHKINILRSQAGDMIRGKWFDCIRPESLRRNFVVQYWSGMPGPKSWIEFGIGSGKQRGAVPRAPQTPQVSVRWFRKGVEIPDETLDFDWKDINLDNCLSLVIARHTEWLLKGLRSQIQELIVKGSNLSVEISSTKKSSEKPVLSSSGRDRLSLRHKSLREPIQVRIEPVTGQWSISPAMPSTAHTERQLNNNPSANVAKHLVLSVCKAASDRSRKQAELVTWRHCQEVAKYENLQRVFGEAVQTLDVFTPSKAWGSDWALAVTFSISGMKWWAVSLVDSPAVQANGTKKIIKSAHLVPQPDAISNEDPLSKRSLMDIERLAVAEVSFSAIAQQLSEMNIPFSIKQAPMNSAGRGPIGRSAATTKTIFLKFSDLMKSMLGKGVKPWASDTVRLSHLGITPEIHNGTGESGSVRHDLRLILEPGTLKGLQKHLTNSQDRDLAMNATGGLALKFLVPFGQPFVERIQTRLQNVERLNRFVEVLQQTHVKCTRANLSRISFTYNKTPELTAQLQFSKDGGFPIELKLQPRDSNPHQRIRAFLEKSLNHTPGFGFKESVSTLKLTLPLLQNLEQLERIDPAKQSLIVHPRNATWFTLKYRAPLPACEFELKAKQKTEGATVIPIWHLDAKTQTAVPDDLLNALKELWQGKGEHWQGVGTGLVADWIGIGEGLKKLDQTVRRFEGATTEASKQQQGDAQKGSSQPQAKALAPAPSAAAHTSTVHKPTDVIMLD